MFDNYSKFYNNEIEIVYFRNFYYFHKFYNLIILFYFYLNVLIHVYIIQVVPLAFNPRHALIDIKVVAIC